MSTSTGEAVQSPVPSPRVARPRPIESTATPTTTLSDALAEAALIAAPPLGALAIMSITGAASLSDAPGVWITLCAAGVVGITTLAAIIDRRHDHATDAAAIAWPMLLIWPFAHVWLLATRAQIGKKSRLLSGLAGSVAMVAAVAFAQHTVEQARSNLNTPHKQLSEIARQQANEAKIEALIQQESMRR